MSSREVKEREYQRNKRNQIIYTYILKNKLWYYKQTSLAGEQLV